MANELNIEITGLSILKGADKILYDAVKKATDEIADDLVKTATGLAPRKTGKLENSGKVEKQYASLSKCTFTAKFSATKKGFDYAQWTEQAEYNLGTISKSKPPVKGKFMSGSARVGRGYLSNPVKLSKTNWTKYMQKKALEALNRKIKG